MPSTMRTVASALAGAATVAAHGYVHNIIVNGVYYAGYDVTTFPYQQDPPAVIGWSTTATDTGFVAPDAYSEPDIICHRDAENAQAHAQVAAGDSIYLQWNTWPVVHPGPVLNYLASCGDVGCESVDKTSLEFFKISEKGQIDLDNARSGTPGFYAADELLQNDIGWMVRIPENIAPGNYVLRHEIIALHSGGDPNGAQNYPQCFNLQITGSGSSTPEGVLGTELYTPEDAGILYNIYQPSEYTIPGPPLIEGVSDIEQGTSSASTTASGTVGSGQPLPTNPPTTTESPETPDNGDDEDSEEGDSEEGDDSEEPEPPAPTSPPSSPEDPSASGGPAPIFSTISEDDDSNDTPTSTAPPAIPEKTETPEEPDNGNGRPGNGNGKPGKGKPGKGKDFCKVKKRELKSRRHAKLAEASF